MFEGLARWFATVNGVELAPESCEQCAIMEKRFGVLLTDLGQIVEQALQRVAAVESEKTQALEENTLLHKICAERLAAIEQTSTEAQSAFARVREAESEAEQISAENEILRNACEERLSALEAAMERVQLLDSQNAQLGAEIDILRGICAERLVVIEQMQRELILLRELRTA